MARRADGARRPAHVVAICSISPSEGDPPRLERRRMAGVGTPEAREPEKGVERLGQATVDRGNCSQEVVGNLLLQGKSSEFTEVRGPSRELQLPGEGFGALPWTG